MRRSRKGTGHSTLQFANINGLRIAYRKAGSGPPLVLLHGILGDSRDWREQLEGLSSDFTVIAWDAPGCGESDDPRDGQFDADQYADCLAGLVNHLGIGRAHVCGLSWGGGLALLFFERHPAMVRSLILADTYAGWKGSLPPEVVAVRLASCIKESEMAPEDFIPGWIPELLTEDTSPELRDEVYRIMSEFHPVGYRVMVTAFAELDLRAILPTIDVPTILIWGEDDKRSPLSVAANMQRNIPNSRLVTIPGAGHMSSMEQPQAFNAAVREFALAAVKE